MDYFKISDDNFIISKLIEPKIDNVLTKAANGLEELKSYKELDLEIPQHFTKEQSAWIKKYCIEKNKEFYNNAIDDCIKAIKSIFIGTMFTTKEECNAFEWTQNKCIELAEQLKRWC